MSEEKVTGLGPCKVCGHDPACGWASVDDDWFCHDDDHTCYGEGVVVIRALGGRLRQEIEED